MSRQSLLVLALVLSLGLNLVVAGVAIGRKGREPPAPPPMAWAARDLAPETRQLVRLRMRDEVEAVRPLRRELREAHAAVRRAVSATDYDPAALKAALGRLRSVNDRYRQLLHDNVADLAAELPPQERMALLRSALQRAESRRLPGPPGS